MIGNGLRTDIWETFQKRFKIPKIVEFFGATEGTAAFVNTWGRVGSCGRISPLMVSQFLYNQCIYNTLIILCLLLLHYAIRNSSEMTVSV